MTPRAPGADREFPGPILGGDLPVPSSRDLRRGGRRRRRPRERVLRVAVLVTALLVLVVALGYGYFRYEWGKVASSPCSACVSVPSGQPYYVLVIGSDSRAGETPAEALHFGSATSAGGQRSDTIKIIRVDPSAGSASSLSIPRDTFVTLSGMPASSELSSANKINAAFGAGPDALIKTIQNTFGIPISHYIVVSFFGLQNAVDALGGISMDFPYPVRDQDCSTGVCNNNSGLAVSTTGCQVLTGAEALALSRSRYFEYEVDGRWIADPTGDLGRIERQNLIISAALNKAKSTYDPFRLNSLFTSLVHDFSKDDGLTANDMLSLAEHYHAFSGSQLAAYTLPTTGASSSAGSVEVVEPDQAAQLLDQFVGGGTRPTIVTPPLNSGGAPVSLPVTTTTAPATSSGAPATSSGSSSAGSPSGSSSAPSIPPYDPRPC